MKRIWLVFIVTIFLVMAVPEAVVASPAYDGLKSYVQPDHTVIEYRLMGDEHFNWRETPDGDIILLDKSSKYYCYGQYKNSKVFKTTARVGVDKKPFIRLTRTNLLSLVDYAIRNEVTISGLTAVSTGPISDATASFSDSYTSLGDSLAGGGDSFAPAPPAPQQKILVVLVEFANIQMSQPDNFWNEAFFSETVKSVNNYYNEVSRGKLSFEPVSETSANIDDGVIRVQMGYNHPATYGFQNTQAMQDKISAIAVEAIEAAASSVTNLSQYDTNTNGVIENSELHITTIFAGYEMANGYTTYNAIWAHAADFGRDTVGDLGGGLKLGGYMAVGERMDAENPITIGVFCHELGHSLGLPDLYDYGNDSWGLGPHSLMAMGSWGATIDGLPGSTPVHLDAWSKMQLGFVIPTSVLTSGAYAVTAQTADDYNVLQIAGGLPGQYFLIERRALSGYDAGLAGYSIRPGVAIYHIDENVMVYGSSNWDGLINENEYRKAVDLEEANMGILGHSALDDDLKAWDGRQYFTLALGMNTFSPKTVPSSGLYDKAIKSPFDSVSANGTQAYPSDVAVTVTSMDSVKSGLSISVPNPSLHANAIANQTYSSQYIRPVIQVHDGVEFLQQGVDFTLQYHNNVYPGKATIDIAGMGGYADITGTTSFVIVPKSLTSLTLQLNEKYSVTGSRYRTVKASWAHAVGASGYYVAYRASTSTVWSTTLVTGTSWSKTLSSGTMYYVKVKPYVVTDDGKRHYSASYSPQKYQYTLKAPSLSLVKYGTRSIKLNVGSVIGENGFDVRRASSLNGTYYHKAYIKANSTYWIDSSTYVGKTYYYKIRAYKVVNGVTIYGPFSTVKYIRR